MVTLLHLPIASADVVGPEDESCLSLHEGDPCDDANYYQNGPAYRGVCVLFQFPEGRSRMRCRVPGPPFSPTQEACAEKTEGKECLRPSGATGRCVLAGSRTVTAAGGTGTVEFPLFECTYFKPDKSGQSTTVAIGLGVTALAIAALVVFLRKRSAARKADEEAKSSKSSGTNAPSG